ncbi:MAG: hypothetical protein ABJA98_22760 [Acidobacteriota bacterium]
MSGRADDLQAVDAATLTPMVRAALGLDRAVVTSWRHEPFGHSLDEVYRTARSVFRFSGTARAVHHEVPWSLVLKIVTVAGTPDDPSSPANGDREPLAYRSFFLDHIPGIRAPRCYAIAERPGSRWLWLEHVSDDLGRVWRRERYQLAARHLARFNVAYLAGRTSVCYPWLSRSPLREAVGEMSRTVARIGDARDHPIVARAVSPESAKALLALLDKSGRWLDRLDRMPQAICHWDAHRANLLSRTNQNGVVETVAIDWAGLGWGPVGSELSKLLSQTVNFFGLDVEALPTLDGELFHHYVDGLREAGWSGDARVVRFGYTAAAAMRLIVRMATAIELAFDDHARTAFERSAGLDFATLADRFKSTLPYYLSLVDEADRLADLV